MPERDEGKDDERSPRGMGGTADGDVEVSGGVTLESVGEV